MLVPELLPAVWKNSRVLRLAPGADLGTLSGMPVREIPKSRSRISIPVILLEGDPPIVRSQGIDESSWLLFLQARSPESVAVHWDVDPATFQRFAAGTEDGCVWVRVWVGPDLQETIVYRAVWRESETVLMTIPSYPGELLAELGGWSRRGEWMSLSISAITKSLTRAASEPFARHEIAPPAVEVEVEVAKKDVEPTPSARFGGVVGHNGSVIKEDSRELLCSRQKIALELFRLVGIANALNPLPPEVPKGKVFHGLAMPWSGRECRLWPERSS